MTTMRRSKQQLSPEVCTAILERNSSGVLALNTEDGPYAAPLSYVFSDGKFIFHSTQAGHKVDAIKHDARASFCVIDADEVVPEKFTTKFRSVIAFGSIKVLDDEQERQTALEALGMKYFPNEAACREEVTQFLKQTLVFVLEPTEITGKRGKMASSL